MPVVTLLGPRQSGKTTLVRHVFPDHSYISLERPDHREAARADPLGFLSGVRDGVILDEVHRVPELLSWIQVDVDEDARPGQFVLTASQNLLLMENVSQSLAGRTAIQRLLPFSLSELRGLPSLDPARLDQPRRVEDPPASTVWEVIFKGMYPQIHDRNLDPGRWLADYERTYVERDVRAVLRVMDLDRFRTFLALTAGRTGQELNLNSLASDAGISQPTARSWLTALRIGSLVTLLPPHHANFSKRLRKRPRLHFLDTGLVCHLLGIADAATLRNHPLRGAIFESFVVAELTKAFVHSGRDAPLYFWRDVTGHEVDVVVDLGDRLIPIEAKSGATVADDAFDSLRWWRELPGNRSESGLLVHGGREAGRRHGFFHRPWFSV